MSDQPFTIGSSTLYQAASALLLAVTCCGVAPAQAQQITLDGIHLNILVYNLTNEYRVSKGLFELRAGIKRPVDVAAQTYAEYQAAHDTTGHEDDGRTPQQRIEAAGGKVCHYSENVFHYYSPSVADTWTVGQQAINWWKNSPPHEANMRTTADYWLWVGAAAWNYGGRYSYYIVQDYLDDCNKDAPRRLAPRGFPK
jgi:uncharacterized protein YkwD